MRKFKDFLVKVTAGTLLFSLFFMSCKPEETPSDPLPVLVTGELTHLSFSSISVNVTLKSEGDSPVTEKGVCWATDSTPTIADNRTIDTISSGNFTNFVSGLTPNSWYMLRAYATNSTGTSYGNQILFKTCAVMDIDSNLYHEVKIGTQVWMGENLKTTHYNNGQPIQLIENNNLWNSDSASYCWFKNDYENFGKVFGALYNFAAAASDNICPQGWHIPSTEEWNILFTYLGGASAAGRELMEEGSAHWQEPNAYANNHTGFTALPGSYRSLDGTFGPEGYYGYWWSSTESSLNKAFAYNMVASRWAVNENIELKGSGFSVRCIKD